SLSRPSTAWLIERLPEVAIASMRSPLFSNRCSLRKQAMLSIPALVRVSEIITMPSRTSMPTQYVISASLDRSTLLLLMAGVIDRDGDSEPFVGAADLRTAHGRRAQIIQADGDADIGFGRADAVGRIEADPAEALHISFQPG